MLACSVSAAVQAQKKSNTKFKNKRTQSNKQKRQPSYVFFAVLLGSLLMILSLLIYCAFCFFCQPGGLDIRWEECNNRIFSHQVFVLMLNIYIYIYIYILFNVETARFC